ncbi:class I SAM-dependent rRNA methyltransferase [Thalassoglobus sp.]|uniref:class I SAM-dependent rRNA methyltransferase n=1 Tax=Thalassoglobus sp. TaxID=2795869 RepID=UPI003AA8F3C7
MTSESTYPVVTLKPKKALPFFSRHPWMYANAIKTITNSPDVGAEVVVLSNDGKFIGRGLYNPQSKIRVRLYSWEEEQLLERPFWERRIKAAIDLRRKLFGDGPAWKACRLIFSESDGLSGLTVDRVDDWLVVQWTSAALIKHQAEILEILQAELSPKGIWLRTEKGIKELEGLDVSDGLLSGERPPRPLFIEENGLQFGVDLVEGQKTGFYFDQRENRKAFAGYADGANVLDVCCYTGSFALNAAKQPGCQHVHAIDSSASALELAKGNAELNELSAKITFQHADAFDALEELVAEKKRFDLIILDPPKMARTRGGLSRAIKGYVRMNRMAMELMNPNGILMTCSCSGHVTHEDFEQVVARAALDANKTVQILEERGQAPDHPVISSCLETSYLKTFICRVSS